MRTKWTLAAVLTLATAIGGSRGVSTSAPHFYLVREVDVSRLKTWRERASARSGARITYTDVLVRLVAAALLTHPRVNVAWDIDGEGNNVLRGGYGMFYNRNMGNVEYDNTLRLPPNAYQVNTSFWDGNAYGNGLGLTYDTIHEATLANRIGSVAINSLTPDSFTWPKTHSYSVSFARRIPWNQVVEVSYVGTKGRDLVSRSNGNVMGRLASRE